MTKPISTPPPVLSSRIFLSTFALAKLTGISRASVLRAVVRNEIQPDGFLDAGRALQPFFSPNCAVILARRGASSLTPPNLQSQT